MKVKQELFPILPGQPAAAERPKTSTGKAAAAPQTYSIFSHPTVIGKEAVKEKPVAPI